MVNSLLDWYRAISQLSIVMAQAVHENWNNKNSVFRKDAPIPKWLDVSLTHKERSKLIKRKPDMGQLIFGDWRDYDYEEYHLSEEMIKNSKFDGYLTTAEFTERYGVKGNLKSISLILSGGADKRNIKKRLKYLPHPYPYNGGVFVYAYPIQYLEDYFKEAILEKGKGEWGHN